MIKTSSRNNHITQNNFSVNITNELNNANSSINNIKFTNEIITNELTQNLKPSLTVQALKQESLKKESNKENQEQTLEFNNNKIANNDGKLKEGLVYMKDFVVLPKRMFQLFYKWYGKKNDIEIKRTKIYLEDDDDIIEEEKDKDKDKEKKEENEDDINNQE